MKFIPRGRIQLYQRPLRVMIAMCIIMATLTQVLKIDFNPKIARTPVSAHKQSPHTSDIRLDDRTELVSDLERGDTSIDLHLISESTTVASAHLRRIAPVLESQVPRNTTCNSVGPSSSASATIEQKMANACSRKGRVSRTWVDNMLPPDECVKFSQISHERDRCLYVSDHQAPGVIVVYVCFGLVGSCLFILLFVACVRRRRQTSFVARNIGDIGAPPKYRGIGYDGQDGRSDLASPVSMRMTADGLNDGWTSWLKRKSRREQNIQATQTSAPRLPSLHLPRPTFATVRKMSGIGPDPYDRQKSRTSKGTGRLLKRGSYI